MKQRLLDLIFPIKEDVNKGFDVDPEAAREIQLFVCIGGVRGPAAQGKGVEDEICVKTANEKKTRDCPNNYFIESVIDDRNRVN